MSDELKRKLLNYEVNPPEVMWDKIADSLNEEITAAFPRRLYEAEVIPPSGGWNNIAFALDTSKEDYPAKLYTFEVTPPAEAWETISVALSGEVSLPFIRPKRKLYLFVRYAAAASVIAAIAFGTFKLVNQKRAAHPIATERAIHQNTLPTVAPPVTNEDSSKAIETTSSNLTKEKMSTTKTNAQFRRTLFQTGYMTQMVNPTPVSTGSLASNFQQASLRGEVPGNCPLISDADRYLMFINPDGYLIRISRKLAETLGCFYTNGNSEEYNQCQEQIRKWRDKIAQSPATSSPDNFMDILNIIKSAQENEL
jgi:hypothetical protein